jgi:hypothetical protein
VVTSAGNLSDKWAIFRYFLGDWVGSGTGKPGESSAERTYALTLADQFIKIKHRSIYEPQAANPSGEIHEELGLISFDKVRSQYVFREFHVEGYVNQYVLDQVIEDGSVLTFVTEAIENMSPDWRARTTLEILSEDSFREVFDLAGPGKGWNCFITNEFQRVK